MFKLLLYICWFQKEPFFYLFFVFKFFILADKSNCVVVMEKHQYREKTLSMLNDKQTYTTQKSDPTGRTKRDLNQRLLLLKKSSKISEETYKLSRSSNGLAPRYGLPKIHNERVPLRPMVSFVTYGVLCELTNL